MYLNCTAKCTLYRQRYEVYSAHCTDRAVKLWCTLYIQYKVNTEKLVPHRQKYAGLLEFVLVLELGRCFRTGKMHQI